MASRFRSLGAFTLFVAVACSDTTATRERAPTKPASIRVRDCEGPALSVASDLVAALVPRDGRMQPDDQWADLALRVPGGFAGVIYSDGKPVLFLTDPSKAAQAKQALASQLGSFDVTNAIVRQARWDFAQLVDWNRYISSRPELSIRDIAWSSSDRDESINRLHYGVVDEASRTRLIEVLSALNVPCDLAVIDIEPRAVLTDRAFHSR
jgi:hypothetical protein